MIQKRFIHAEGVTTDTSIDINALYDSADAGLIRLTWWVGIDVPDVAGGIQVEMVAVDRVGGTSNMYATGTGQTISTAAVDGVSGMYVGQHAANAQWDFNMSILFGAAPTYSYQILAELIGESEQP